MDERSFYEEFEYEIPIILNLVWLSGIGKYGTNKIQFNIDQSHDNYDPIFTRFSKCLISLN